MNFTAIAEVVKSIGVDEEQFLKNVKGLAEFAKINGVS